VHGDNGVPPFRTPARPKTDEPASAPSASDASRRTEPSTRESAVPVPAWGALRPYFFCPLCGSRLHEMRPSSDEPFRCEEGHALSPEAGLAHPKGDRLDATLEGIVQALHDTASVLRKALLVSLQRRSAR
jgi:hypothetical protein